jgi:hypothetical protein
MVRAEKEIIYYTILNIDQNKMVKTNIFRNLKLILINYLFNIKYFDLLQNTLKVNHFGNFKNNYFYSNTFFHPSSPLIPCFLSLILEIFLPSILYFPNQILPIIALSLWYGLAIQLIYFKIITYISF